MKVKCSIKVNVYKDSVSLMRISQLVVSRTSVQRTTLLMGTRANKEFLAQAKLMRPELDAAQPSDIMIVVEDCSDETLAVAEREIHSLIEGEESRAGSGSSEQAVELAPRSIAAGVSRAEQADLALISVPGSYAASEAMKALRQGLSVLLFSDNVPIEQERELKEIAQRKNLLVMGPDCGTAVINGVPLGFANVVRRGSVGLVGASGTGLQEIMCQVHRLGEGLSHAIGTGSRDVYEDIGGATMLQGLGLLAADKSTKVIAIISKPPAPLVQQRVLAAAASLKKPVVVCFLGGNPAASGDNVHCVATLQEAAAKAVALAKGAQASEVEVSHAGAVADELCSKLKPSQRFIRGLYSGGTFCSEAQVIWQRRGISAYSNVPLNYHLKLQDENQSVGHTAVDLGSDEFTVGRPHPMIDYSGRIDRLQREARDPDVACVVLDVVLGYGSHEDPASVLAPAIRAAKASARQDGRELPIVCFICGTEDDPQRLAAQSGALAREGVIHALGSTDAASIAADIAARMASNEAAPDRRAQQGKGW